MQAIIMTAYKNPQGTMELLRCLAPKMPCYVHVDAGGEITDEETAQMNRIEGVHAWKKYRVNWGSIRHLEALCFLMKEALCDKNVSMLHLISAEDFPIRTWSHFEELDQNRIYMQMIRTREFPELTHRYAHFHFMSLINYRDSSEKMQNWVGRIDRWQDLLHIKRRYVPEWKGLVWCSLPREAALYALNSSSAKALFRHLRFTYIPEEFYFQNVFAGSEFEKRIVPNNRRFSIWNQPERGMPAVLEEKDLVQAEEKDLFARKVVPGTPLFRLLRERWEGGQ